MSVSLNHWGQPSGGDFGLYTRDLKFKVRPPLYTKIKNKKKIGVFFIPAIQKIKFVLTNT